MTLGYLTLQKSIPKELAKEGRKMGIKIELISLRKELELNSFDVVYDQYISKNKDQQKRLRNFHKACQRKLIPIFNSYSFIKLTNDKWKSYQVLKKNNVLKEYLPLSYQLSQKTAKEKHLNWQEGIILKPRWGSKGEGIIFIRKEKEEYIFTYQKRIKNKLKITQEKKENLNALFPLLGSKKYILQQKINSVKINGRLVDFRVIVQKLKDSWQISGIGARIAPREGFLTNICQGGKLVDGVLLFKKIFPNEWKTILAKINKLSIDLIQYFEEQSKNSISEAGLDLMIDENKKVWFLEINSKPSGVIVYRRGLKKLGKKMMQNTLYFAKDLVSNKKDIFYEN